MPEISSASGSITRAVTAVGRTAGAVTAITQGASAAAAPISKVEQAIIDQAQKTTTGNPELELAQALANSNNNNKKDDLAALLPALLAGQQQAKPNESKPDSKTEQMIAKLEKRIDQLTEQQKPKPERETTETKLAKLDFDIYNS